MARKSYSKNSPAWSDGSPISGYGSYYGPGRPRRPQSVKFGTGKNGVSYVQGFCYKKGQYMTFVGCPAKKGVVSCKGRSGKEFERWVVKITFPNECRTILANGFYGDKGGSSFVKIPDYDILLSNKGNGGSVVLGSGKNRR